jgi:hypothetical protein
VKIRGIGTRRFNAAVSPSVGVYVNEVAKPGIDTAFTNLNDVEYIEVLKGTRNLSVEDVDNHSSLSGILNATYDADLGDTGLSWCGRGEVSYGDDFIGLSKHDLRRMLSCGVRT